MQRIAGSFELVRPLSRGGMGVIWEGKHVVTSTPVAMKVIMSDPGRSGAGRMLRFRKMFRAEVRATARLNHPNVVQILDYGILPDSIVPLDGLSPRAPYYVMPLANAMSLTEFRPQRWAQLLDLLSQVLRGLAHAHAYKVIHRDVKPANILIHQLETKRFILTDFGIAHAADPDRWTFSENVGRGSASGTPHYMAPEQFRGNPREYGPWTDLYGIGIMAFQMTTGRLPFRGTSLRQLGMDHLSTPVPSIQGACLFAVPDGFESWLWRMTAKALEDRTSTAAQALAELKALGAPTSAFVKAVGEGLESAPTLTETEVFESATTASRFQPVRIPEPVTVPMPQDWRDLQFLGHEQSLSGVGLGLFGLRRFPMVDRDAQRDVLWSELSLCRQNKDVRAVVLEGARGTGKSSLMDWISHLALEAGVAQVLRDGPRSRERRDRGLVGLLLPYFQTSGMSSRGIGTTVSAALEQLGALSVGMTRVLTSVLESESANRRAVVMSTVPRAQAVESIGRFLGHLARTGPLVVSIDDAHFNAAGIALVSHMLADDTRRHQGILFVLSVTDDEDGQPLTPLLSHDRLTRIRVERLEAASISKMIRSVALLPEAELNEIAERSEGSPLFAVQLVNDWVQRGVFQERSGRIVATGKTPPLPATITELWMDRVRSLVDASNDATASRRIQILATLGRESSDTEISSVFAQESLGDPERFIDHAARFGLVQRTQGGVRLAHGLLRDAILQQALEAERVSLHGACATALATLYQNPAPATAMRLAQHWLVACDFEKAFDAIESACLHARRTYDVSSLMLWTQTWIGGLDRCADAMPARWVQALSLRSYAFLLGAGSNDRAEAVRLARQAQEWATQAESADIGVIATARWAMTTLYTQDAAAGIEALEPRIEACTDPNVAAEAWITLARLRAALGDNAQALRAGHEAESLAAEETLKIQAFQVLARAYLERDDLDQAAMWIAQAISMAQGHGYLVAEARSHQTLAFIADARGDYVAAETSHRAALELFALATPQSAYPLAEREYVGRALLAQRRFDEAECAFNEVILELAQGKVGFRQNVYDGLLACAAFRKEWSRYDSLLDAATEYDFAPSNLNIRALQLALAELGEGPRAEELSTRLARWT